MTRRFQRMQQLGTPVSIGALCVAGLLATGCAETPAANDRQVILISVDGLTTADYLNPDNGLSIPNLQALRDNGCAANGMTGVFPTTTYPSHTAMITGQPPAVHGIYTNTPLDPFNIQPGAWFFYADRITAPTLWQVLREAGKTTAAISWPVTVGAEVDYLLPEFGPVRTPETVALSAALSTPGLFREMIAVDSVNRPMIDTWRTNATVAILNTRHPDLLALHLSDLDAAQHAGGPHTEQAHTTLEKIDSLIGVLRTAVSDAGRADQTAWVIVSDHGFLPTTQQINPMVVLRDAGLITTDASGRITDWKVFMNNGSGSAFLEVRDPNDAASIAKATELMQTLAADPANGIAKVYTRDELKAMQASPIAFLGLGAQKGFAIGGNVTGDVLMTTSQVGKHGFDPSIPELRPAMILSGAGVQTCQLKEGVNIVDVAPTVAGLLGVPMTGITGRDVNTPPTP